MMAENALHQAHIHMLNHEHDMAVEECMKAITEARLMISSIKHMKEQRDALRKQTKTIQT